MIRVAALRARTGSSAILGCLRAWIQADFLEHPPDMCAQRHRFHPARRLPTSRCGPNTEAFANFPQLRSGGRKETAQQSIPEEFIIGFCRLCAPTQPLEDPGHLRRDPGSPGKDPVESHAKPQRGQTIRMDLLLDRAVLHMWRWLLPNPRFRGSLRLALPKILFR